MRSSASLGDLTARGALIIGDGYRTNRAEHGRPGFRILRVADVTDRGIAPTGTDFVDARYRKQIGQKLSEAGDVLLTTKGTVGRVTMMPAFFEAVVYSPQLCFFRVVDRDIIDPRFLQFWFRSEVFLEQASHRMNNSDMAAYINPDPPSNLGSRAGRNDGMPFCCGRIDLV